MSKPEQNENANTTRKTRLDPEEFIRSMMDRYGDTLLALRNDEFPGEEDEDESETENKDKTKE